MAVLRDESQKQSERPASVGHAAERHGIANMGRAITAIPTVDAAATELIAVLSGAIRLFAALDASAAIAGA